MASQLLSTAAGAGQPSSSRSASCFVAKPSRGFQLLRIDGYSWTKALPGGERITSDSFTVGGRIWCVDYYPNGTDPSLDESDSISLYLRLAGAGAATAAAVYRHGHRHKERVRAQYKFSLLDLAGNAAFELPAETGVFTSPAATGGYAVNPTPAGCGDDGQAAAEEVGCGYAEFISREEMERRRDSLLAEDCLVVRCDVGVAEVAVAPPAVAALANYPSAAPPRLIDGCSDPRYGYNNYGGYSYGYNGGPQAQLPPPLDDKEFIRLYLDGNRARE